MSLVAVIGVLLFRKGAAPVIGLLRQSFKLSLVSACDTRDCRQAVEELETAMDKTRDPCQDFYSYVCGRWDAGRPGKKRHPYITEVTLNASVALRGKLLDLVDKTGSSLDIKQSMVKLYKSCIDFVTTNEPFNVTVVLKDMDIDVEAWLAVKTFAALLELAVATVIKTRIPSLIAFTLLNETNERAKMYIGPGRNLPRTLGGNVNSSTYAEDMSRVLNTGSHIDDAVMSEIDMEIEDVLNKTGSRTDMYELSLGDVLRGVQLNLVDTINKNAFNGSRTVDPASKVLIKGKKVIGNILEVMARLAKERLPALSAYTLLLQLAPVMKLQYLPGRYTRFINSDAEIGVNVVCDELTRQRFQRAFTVLKLSISLHEKTFPALRIMTKALQDLAMDHPDVGKHLKLSSQKILTFNTRFYGVYICCVGFNC